MARTRPDIGESQPLPEGIYEHLVTEHLERALLATVLLDKTYALLGEADAHIALARHVGREIERALDALPRDQRAEHARLLARTLIDHLATLVDGDVADLIREQRPSTPPRRLTSLYRGAVPARPRTPLSTSTLLTRSRGEPPLGQELGREIATSDQVDAIIAFVTVSGVNAIRDALHDFSRRSGARLRLLTTTFGGITEIAALDAISRLPNAEVKISFDTRRTRLHAKAWLFHRNSGMTTAYIGSANLTSTALGAGHEWMVKVCAADLPHVIQQFDGTFDTLWADSEFESYVATDEVQRARLAAALSAEKTTPTAELFLVALRALPFQQEILDKLEAERVIHNRRRNLVVAATGTGKTVIAALDYARQFETTGVAPRLLFLAHRYELLDQARTTFRHALQDRSFGELLVDGQQPKKWDHVFASIQSAAASDLVEKFGPQYFTHVIVDECHHVPAKSYQEIVPRLQPRLLVGLTATPERSDGKSLLPDFDDHIAAELRLWHALDDQLLVPFEYFGISDGVDLRRVRWSRSGYDAGELGGLYTGHSARADLIRHQLTMRVADPRLMRALGFCVSIEHANFMAARFNEAGIPARAVFGHSPDREDAPAALRERRVNVLFTCDLYNEGVDLPFIDTLLFLRPTQSSTLFLQQLGRGLRHHKGKTSCLVLDFIGQHRDEFRFDAIYAAVTGIPRARLRKAVEEGFPYLPSGCALQLDAVARDVILHSLRSSLAGAKRLSAELRELSADAGRPTLAQFLDQTGRTLEDVYEAGGWTTLQRNVGLISLTENEDAETIDDLSKRLGRLQHIDEPDRLRSYRDLLADGGTTAPLTAQQRQRVVMLESQLHHRGVLRAAETTVAYLAARPSIVRELEELREVLEDRVGLAAQTLPVPEWSLALHRHYSRREIVAGVGYVEAGDKSLNLQAGILQLKDQKRELLFVTLDKSSSDFSPTTRYRDYAISPTLFHWETQSAASVTRPSGQRYIESPANGWSFYLFVRPTPDAPFAFLGPAVYETHNGDRPIAITWSLAYAMPASLYDRYATLRPG
ncbi:MAG: type restriction enzyme res subunit [Myxococcaceae bacterium]|nr:type restriction enzyme res subunit [Myxococcaceae bacterium]